jgi:hypothetical protein
MTHRSDGTNGGQSGKGRISGEILVEGGDDLATTIGNCVHDVSNFDSFRVARVLEPNVGEDVRHAFEGIGSTRSPSAAGDVSAGT